MIGPNVVQAIIDDTGDNWKGFPFLFALCTAASLVIWFGASRCFFFSVLWSSRLRETALWHQWRSRFARFCCWHSVRTSLSFSIACHAGIAATATTAASTVFSKGSATALCD